MTDTLIYTGIGSRSTPGETLELMTLAATQMAQRWTLRSGYADGADKAFSNGAFAGGGDAEIYLPWRRFNNAPSHAEDDRFIDMGMYEESQHNILAEAAKIAAAHHPAWERCSETVRKLHTRNVFQVLGENLLKPSVMLICWTPGGSGSGGTGQALRIARSHGVPIFDLGDATKLEPMIEFITNMTVLHTREQKIAA